jgi:uncharacterized protein YcbK (DUF882 family)
MPPVVSGDLGRTLRYPAGDPILAVAFFAGMAYRADIDFSSIPLFPIPGPQRPTTMYPLFRFLKISCLLAACTLLLPGFSGAEQPLPRFFVMGHGSLHLENLRNHRAATVNLLNKDGSFNEEDFNKVDWLFDFPTAEKGEHISPRLLFMLSYFVDRMAPGALVHIESAYRSPEYNQRIRDKGNNAARTSTHQDGMALDFWLAGVDGKQLWETIREKHCGGVGHYGGRVVHLDAGRPRFWEAATSGALSPEPDYNRKLYLSTEFDRYRSGERIRLGFSNLSSFDFGVSPTIEIVHADQAAAPVATVRPDQAGRDDCLRIGDRRAARSLTAALPAHLPPGRYALKVGFCAKPFAQMPSETVSNPIELVP